MANPRTTSEFWDGSEEEFQHELHYPNATPRRALFAHALGVVGVLGTLTLAGFAFAPRLGKLGTLFLKDEAAQYPAKPVAQVPAAPPTVTNIEVVPPLPVAPLVAAPEPPSANGALGVAPLDTATPGETNAASTEPSAPSSEPKAAPAEPSVAPVAPPVAPSETVAPALAAAAAPSAAADQTHQAAGNSAAQSAKAAAPERAPVVTRRAPRAEPEMTQREIERRKARYEEWLKDQGLERVH